MQILLFAGNEGVDLVGGGLLRPIDLLDGPAERGCQQVIVIDMDDGKVLGRVQASPQP